VQVTDAGQELIVMIFVVVMVEFPYFVEVSGGGGGWLDSDVAVGYGGGDSGVDVGYGGGDSGVDVG